MAAGADRSEDAGKIGRREVEDCSTGATPLSAAEVELLIDIFECLGRVLKCAGARVLEKTDSHQCRTTDSYADLSSLPW